ncbi:hypothetical protein [Bacillus paralicheniformis]|uniref:hypothetical protein n=1 Tax=Bacillus paralicheniformis TaxID=1648923 RepID=UPI0035F57ED2
MAESFPFVYISKNSGNGAVKRELPENPVVFKTNSLRKSKMNFLTIEERALIFQKKLLFWLRSNTVLLMIVSLLLLRELKIYEYNIYEGPNEWINDFLRKIIYPAFSFCTAASPGRYVHVRALR